MFGAASVLSIVSYFRLPERVVICLPTAIWPWCGWVLLAKGIPLVLFRFVLRDLISFGGGSVSVAEDRNSSEVDKFP